MLLLDENISYRIVKELDIVYPGTMHITDLLSTGSTDQSVWEAALEYGLTIVTFDADYKDLLNLKGFPPKVIWLRFGNCSNRVLSNTLQLYPHIIKAFVDSAKLGVLEINSPIY